MVIFSHIARWFNKVWVEPRKAKKAVRAEEALVHWAERVMVPLVRG